MLYHTLRAASRVALHWYYSDVIVQGRERVPRTGPVLIVANHPNALVDALLVGTTIDRRVLLTAKATLFGNPALAALLSTVGVVPLRRARDEPTGGQARNELAFQRVTDALARNGVVLIFPEGISHDEPALAPLRTGAARMAYEAHGNGVKGLRILPVGLIFEEKERPRSRVLVRIGEPLDVDMWTTQNLTANAALLTHEIDTRLREVTLNFANTERAQRAVRVARALTAMAHEPHAIGNSSPFEVEADIARRIEHATNALESASPQLVDQADRFTARIATLEALLGSRGAALSHARISVRNRHGLLFLVRESAIALVALPVALLGRITHWLPIRMARTLALRSIQGDPSKDQPAMRTIVIGLASLLVWYGLQVVLVSSWLGILAALLWLAMIFVAARVDLVFADRARDATSRARTFIALRRDGALRLTVQHEVEALLEDAKLLEQSLLSPAR